MSRKPEDRIDDIIECCEKIGRYIVGLDRGTFAEEELVEDAVLRNPEIIGEAIKNLPHAISSQLPHVDWKGLAGMRDILSHAYFRVDPDIVWGMIQTEVPELLRTLQAFRGESKE